MLLTQNVADKVLLQKLRWTCPVAMKFLPVCLGSQSQAQALLSTAQPSRWLRCNGRRPCWMVFHAGPLILPLAYGFKRQLTSTRSSAARPLVELATRWSLAVAVVLLWSRPWSRWPQVRNRVHAACAHEAMHLCGKAAFAFPGPASSPDMPQFEPRDVGSAEQLPVRS